MVGGRATRTRADETAHRQQERGLRAPARLMGLGGASHTSCEKGLS